MLGVLQLIRQRDDAAAAAERDAEEPVSYTHLDVYKRQAGKGLGWADEIRAAVRRLGYVRACKNREPLIHGYG